MFVGVYDESAPLPKHDTVPVLPPEPSSAIAQQKCPALFPPQETDMNLPVGGVNLRSTAPQELPLLSHSLKVGLELDPYPVGLPQQLNDLSDDEILHPPQNDDDASITFSPVVHPSEP